jgi:hypothetical protein
LEIKENNPNSTAIWLSRTYSTLSRPTAHRTHCKIK